MKAKYSLLKVFNFTDPRVERVNSFELWSNDEVKYLVDNYKQKSIPEIAKDLKRSKPQVWNKFYRLAEQGVVKAKKRKRGLKHGGGYKAWTKEEEQYLKENYTKETWDILTKKLKRNKETIMSKAHRLGVKNREYKRSSWTIRKKEYLIENYNKKSIKEIAEYLRISYSTVANMAYNLGLTNPDWTKKEEEYLRENYKKYKVSYMSKELGRSPTAIYSKAYKMGITR